jgi:hypothetical protein
MRCLKCCVAPVRATATVCAVIAALVGGCANSRTAERAEVVQRQWVGAPPAPIPGQQAAEAYKAEAGDPIKDPPVEPVTRRAEQDDPSEPFSPNYGRAAPSASARVRLAGAGG